MEISLVSGTGLPEEAILSIRKGSVRRQGPASCNKPLRFPQKEKAPEADRVLKVDIYQKVGSGYIVLKPNQDGTQQYRVALDGGGGDMACDLEVKSAAGPATESAEAAEALRESMRNVVSDACQTGDLQGLLDGRPASAPMRDMEAKPAAKKQDSGEYLKDKGLLHFVQGVLQVVVKEQPEDPFTFMAKHFQSGYGSAVKPDRGTATSRPSSPTREEKDDGWQLGSSIRFYPEDDVVQVNTGCESMRSVRDRAATGGWTPADLESALDEIGVENTDEVAREESCSLPAEDGS